jgi:hypothetical protein
MENAAGMAYAATQCEADNGLRVKGRSLGDIA